MNKLFRQPKAKWWLLTLVAIIGMSGGFIGVGAITSGPKPDIRKTTSCPGICVELTPDGMKPDELALKVGEFVQFNSVDGKSHNIAEGDGKDTHAGHGDPEFHDHVGGFVSGEFGADEAWRVQFKKPGTYKLHDHHNPNQKILIVVYEDKIQKTNL